MAYKVGRAVRRVTRVVGGAGLTKRTEAGRARRAEAAKKIRAIREKSPKLRQAVSRMVSPSDKPPGVRWGKLYEIDRRSHVGSTAWFLRHPETRLRKLSSWRRLHKLRAHSTVSRFGRKLGYKPSSNMPLSKMITSVNAYEEGRAPT